MQSPISKLLSPQLDMPLSWCLSVCSGVGASLAPASVALFRHEVTHALTIEGGSGYFQVSAWIEQILDVLLVTEWVVF